MSDPTPPAQTPDTAERRERERRGNGGPIAVVVTYSRIANLMFYPLLVASQSIPKVAVAPRGPSNGLVTSHAMKMGGRSKMGRSIRVMRACILARAWR